jgi:hypothetical protein
VREKERNRDTGIKRMKDGEKERERDRERETDRESERGEL